MKEEMIHIATHQRALSLLNYYRNKAKLCICANPNGRPKKRKSSSGVGKMELKREQARVLSASKQIAALEADRALLANEVIHWRAAFIRAKEDLGLVQDSKLREAIARTNGRDTANRTTTTNPIIRSRRPRDSDTVSPKCKSLLPKIPKPCDDLETRSRVSELRRRVAGTDDSEN